jgi:hypothetical protein
VSRLVDRQPVRREITPEQSCDVRARAWAYVFTCYAKKKAARPGGPEDAKETKSVRARTSISRQS